MGTDESPIILRRFSNQEIHNSRKSDPSIWKKPNGIDRRLWNQILYNSGALDQNVWKRTIKINTFLHTRNERSLEGNNTNVFNAENHTSSLVYGQTSFNDHNMSISRDGDHTQSFQIGDNQLMNTDKPTTEKSDITTPASTREDLNQGPQLLFSQGSVSKDAMDMIQKVLKYIQYPIQIFAVVFGMLSVAVYFRKEMKSPTSIYLIALNLSEVFYVASTVIFEVTGQVYGEKASYSYVYLSVGLYLSNYISIALRRSTFCITALVSAERFIAVTFPLKSKHFRLIRFPLVFIVGTTVVSFICHLYSVFKYTVVSNISPITNETMWKFAFKDKSNLGQLEVMSLASKVIFVYIPLIVCLILNVATVVIIRGYNQRRRELGTDTRNEARERQTTVTILVSTFVLVLFALPTTTNAIVVNMRNDYGPFTREHYLFFSMIHIGAFFDLLSNSSNFFFYITLSSRFRKSFMDLFRCTPITPVSTKPPERISCTSFSTLNMSEVNSIPLKDPSPNP
ncbi:hypothetical protein SNE40_010383 [Patella caerulea]|uniref:G-protein coupled receptors family 1 profile domain-containing protein n=1 Tax=Patella caerulea TaxID=87958 RepID=A0AAN8PSS4_PATCE